jgi:8-oxo-dGTP diphosphatase
MLIGIIGKLWKVMPREMRRWLTRRLHTSFTVSAAGIITNAGGQVLLLNHVLRPVSGWGLPGGFLDRGEQPEAALRRELREETGLDLTDVAICRVRTLRTHIEIIFMARGIGEPEVKSREIIELRWFDVEDMPGEMSLDQHSVIKKALRR